VSQVVPFAVDLAMVAMALPRVERGRLRSAVGPLLARLRVEGRRRPARSAAGRARLVRAIGWVDRLGPGGPNCLRRALLRVALDPDAARDPLVFGLDVPSAKGHAWVSGAESDGRFDVEFRV
jgi:Transglutaminase-like superfamily